MALRCLPRVADLPEDLALAEHCGVETRRHGKEVVRGPLVEVAVEVIGERLRREAGVLRDEVADVGVRAVEALGDDVHLGAVARREQDGFGDVGPGAEVVERLRQARTVDARALEDVERSDAVVQTDDDYRHGFTLGLPTRSRSGRRRDVADRS